MITVGFLILTLFAGCLAVIPEIVHPLHVPSTVKSLDMKAYAGRWFQIGASLIPNMTFERDGFCITADYAIIEGGKFNLTNTQRVGNPATGKIETFTGTLVNPDPSALGKWKIENMWFSFYWVVAVGTPVNGLYPWSIVSDPLGATSFVLARDVATYNLYYSAVVNGILEEEGLMKKWNEMHTTYQLGNCAYTW